MKAIIVDDESSNLENLKRILNQISPDLNVCALAKDIESARALILTHSPDIVFLDVRLRNQTGFDLLKLLPNREFEVIFVTAFGDFALDAIKFAALDYILKPIDTLELSMALEKAKVRIGQKTRNSRLEHLLTNLNIAEQRSLRIALPTFEETRFVVLEDILRCEADASYTRFLLRDNGVILVSKSLKEYADILLNHGFIRPHHSHLVNSYYIKSWLREDGGVLLMNDLSKVPISKSNRKDLKEMLSKIHRL